MNLFGNLKISWQLKQLKKPKP